MNLTKAVYVPLFIANACLISCKTFAQPKTALKIKHNHANMVPYLVDLPSKNALHDLLPISDEFAITLNTSGNYDFTGYLKMEDFYQSFELTCSDTLVSKQGPAKLMQSFSDGQYTFIAVMDKEADALRGDAECESLILIDKAGKSLELVSEQQKFADVERQNEIIAGNFDLPADENHSELTKLDDILKLFISGFNKYREKYLGYNSEKQFPGATYRF